MLWVPQKGRVKTDSDGIASAAGGYFGTSAFTAATATAKGNPAELFASTAFDAYWVTVLASQYGAIGNASQGCVDILTGAATEEVLIPNLLMGYCGGNVATLGGGPKRWDFPLYVPAGSRLAFQAAGNRTSSEVRVSIALHGGRGYPFTRVGSKVTTYGMGTVPNGTTITPGASGADGSWTQIAAATSEDHFAFVPSFQVTGDTTCNNRNLFVQMGTGSATEQVLGPVTYWFETDSNEQMGGPYNSFPVFADVPSGTRLAMRASCDGTLDGGYNGLIHAVS